MQAALAADSMTPLELQLGAVRERYPGAVLRTEAGTMVLSVPDVRIADGWSKERAGIHFVVPPGFPHANPDCFSTDPDLRLAGGAMPGSAQIQPMPVVGEGLWFSWHLQGAWKPGRDTLLTWIGVCLRRFEALS